LVTGGLPKVPGAATLHVIGTADSWEFISTEPVEDAGVAWHLLDVPAIGALGPAKLKAGHISIWP
jgi:hypothetical protein